MVCERFIKFDPTNYRYTVKYVIWDYLKGLDQLSIQKVVNLSRICGYLVGQEAIPMHFFKVIDFSTKEQLSKPTVLYLHLMLQAVMDSVEQTEQLKIVFVKGLKDQKNQSFVNGLTQFILGKFYKRMQKQHKGSLPKPVSIKIKAIFNVIKNLQQQQQELDPFAKGL